MCLPSSADFINPMQTNICVPPPLFGRGCGGDEGQFNMSVSTAYLEWATLETVFLKTSGA